MTRKIVHSVFLLVCTLIFYTGCGIDNFVYLYPVTFSPNIPYASATTDGDPEKNYFSFYTTDDTNNAEFYFKGFEIYYRIYSNLATLTTDVSGISTYNTNSPTDVYNYIVNTKKYVRLNTSARLGIIPVIPKSGSSYRVVKIRLIDYGTDVADQKSLTIDGVNQSIPLRTINEVTADDVKYQFIFDQILSTDTDVTFGTWDDENNHKWYVQAFVLAYGSDESYKPIYSGSFSLGAITVVE